MEFRFSCDIAWTCCQYGAGLEQYLGSFEYL